MARLTENNADYVLTIDGGIIPVIDGSDVLSAHPIIEIIIKVLD